MPRTLSNEAIVRNSRVADLPAMLEIYNDAIVNLTATFDLEPQSVHERMEWFIHHGDKFPLISAVARGKVVGYCSLSPFSAKKGYSPTVELSVYVHKNFRRRGVGKLLMEEIISRAKKLGYHAIMSLIAGDNEPSVELHKKLGFFHVAHLKEVGFKFSKWQDVDYYELLL